MHFPFEHQQNENVVIDIPVHYNRHYITTDSQDRVIAGWSDGPHPERDTSDAICINEQEMQIASEVSRSG